jgi:hypothetical protein
MKLLFCSHCFETENFSSYPQKITLAQYFEVLREVTIQSFKIFTYEKDHWNSGCNCYELTHGICQCPANLGG